MDMNDIPIVRALPMIAGVAKVAVIGFGLVAIPGLVLYEAIKTSESKSTEEAYYHTFHAIGWAGVTGAYYMLVLGTIVNMFGGPDIMAGEWWFYLSKLFINSGSSLFWTDLVFYLVVAVVGFVISWLFGSETEMGTFLPRWY